MEEQLEKELRFHLEQHTTDLIARGDDPSYYTRRGSLREPRASQSRMASRRIFSSPSGFFQCGPHTKRGMLQRLLPGVA